MNKQLPLVSVIVPTYNSPDLQRTLLSVLRQNYPNIQLIVTDDCSEAFSPEETELFLRENAGANIQEFRIIANAENLGTVRNLNYALKLCRGEYIFNLAGDDCFMDDQVLSDWVGEFVRTGANVITAYRAVYDDKLEVFSHNEPTEKQVKKIKKLSPKKLFEDLSATNYIFGCCTARTADCVKKYGFFDEGYRLLEDHPMNLKLLRSGERIHFFDRVVVKYRGGGASAPIRYNPVYEQDVDRVLTNDVLPYTDHPRRARKKHKQWKRDQRLYRHRAQMLEKCGNRSICVAAVQIWYYLHYPIRTLCRLPGRIRKALRKGVK